MFGQQYFANQNFIQKWGIFNNSLIVMIATFIKKPPLYGTLTFLNSPAETWYFCTSALIMSVFAILIHKFEALHY